MYENKFTKIFESNFQRYQGGGILAGDIVKLVDNIESDEWFDKQSDTLRDRVKEFLNGDFNIRVGSVSAKRAAEGGPVQQDQQVDDYYVDIVKELAPGLFTDVMTLPIHLVQKVDENGNLAPIPDSQRREDTSHIKPEEVDVESGSDETNPVFGTKTNEGDKKLADKDTPGHAAQSVDNFDTSAYLRKR